MSSESLPGVLISQPAVVAAGSGSPGYDLPFPTPDKIKAAEAVFSEEGDKAAALFSLGSAGMLAHELLQDAIQGMAEEEKFQETPEKKKPNPPEQG